MDSEVSTHTSTSGNRTPRHYWWHLAFAIVAIGLVVRVLLIIANPSLDQSGMDGPSYQASAIAIFRDGIFADIWQIRVFPPGYSVLLAMTYAATGTTTPLWLLLIQSVALLGAAIYLAVQAVALLGRGWSLLLLALCVLTPSTIEVSTSLMYEGFLVPISMLLCGALIHWIVTQGNRGRVPLILCSFTLVLIHPRSILIPIAIAVVIAVGTRRWATPVAMAVSSMLPLLLLALRNYISQGTFNLSSNLGSNLTMGLTASGEAACSAEIFSPSDYSRLNPIDDERFLACATREIMDDPLGWLSQAPVKLLDHFEPASIRVVSGDRAPIDVLSTEGAFALSILAVTVFLCVCAAGSIYIWRSAVRGHTLALAVTLPIVATGATSVLFYGRERFSYPSLPFSLLLFVAGVAALSKGLQHRDRDQGTGNVFSAG